MYSESLYHSRTNIFLVVSITGLSVGERELEGPKPTVTSLSSSHESSDHLLDGPLIS